MLLAGPPPPGEGGRPAKEAAMQIDYYFSILSPFTYLADDSNGGVSTGTVSISVNTTPAP